MAKRFIYDVQERKELDFLPNGSCQTIDLEYLGAVLKRAGVVKQHQEVTHFALDPTGLTIFVKFS